MNIRYKIEFHTDWHCGSGLSAGADVDALVVKDQNNLPFVPGKTIKGLVREAMEDMLSLSGDVNADKVSLFIKAFGATSEDSKKMGCVFFSNAELTKDEIAIIKDNNAARFMYRSISSTAIDDSGIAVDHSLRKTQVVVPCTLHGVIIDVPEDLQNDVLLAMKYIKRLGYNRNRGLGRCTITKED